MTEKEMLVRLLKNFYDDGGNLFWSWQEMYGLKDNDPELNAHLLKYIKDNQLELNS